MFYKFKEQSIHGYKPYRFYFSNKLLLAKLGRMLFFKVLNRSK